MGNIVDATAILHGLDPATKAFWKSSVIAAAGVTVGDNLLRQLKDSIGRTSGSDDELIFIWTRGIRNRYVDQLIAYKQFNDSRSVILQGGFEAVTFDGDAAVVDDHQKSGRVHALNVSDLFWADMGDWAWLDMNGSVLQWDVGFDSWIGTLAKYMNLGTYARNRHGVINAADDEVR